MTAAVDKDWGMAALGVTKASRTERRTVARPDGSIRRYGAHAAVINVSIAEPRHDAVTWRSITVADHVMTDALIRLIPPGNDSVNRSSGVIRAIHGVTSTGDWFLLADVAVALPAPNDRVDPGASGHVGSWLVVRGHPGRAIINIHGRDA